MKFNYLLCIALVFFGLTVQAQTNKINFEITDENEGNLLSNVLIRVDSDTAIKASNYLGKITFLNLSEGIHTFSFAADNFIVVTQTLIVPKDGVVNQKIYLSPKDISQKVILESTRMLTKLEDSPTKFVVINQKDLRSANNLNPANVSKILDEVSNIQVQQTSVITANSDVRFFGLEGKYTQILRDGIPIYNDYARNFGISQLPPLDVEQIEIMKGASSVFGGGAIGGMINFISKKPSDVTETVMTLNQSTFNETNLNFYSSSKKGKLAATFFVGFTDQNAESIDDDKYIAIPKMRNFTLHPKLFIQLGKKSDLQLSYNFVSEGRKNTEFQTYQKQVDTVYNSNSFQTERHSFNVIYTLKASGKDALTVKSSASYFNFYPVTSFVTKYGTQPVIIPNEGGRQINYFSELNYLHYLGKKSKIIFGSSFNVDLFENYSTSFFNYNPITGSAFTQFSTNISKKISADFGLRYEHVELNHTPISASLSNNYVLPSLNVVYRLSKDLSFRAGLNSGYKSQNWTQPFYTVNGSSIIDGQAYFPANTVGEKSFSGNLEWNYSKKINSETKISFAQTFFATLIVDPLFLNINYRVPQTPVYNTAYTESHPILTRGIDNLVAAQIKNIALQFNYTFTLPEWQKEGGAIYLPYTPLNRIILRMGYEIPGKWQFGLSTIYNGVQYRPVESNGIQTTTTDFILLGLNATRIFKKFNLTLNGENLLDVRQQKFEPIYSLSNPIPTYKTLYAPIYGRSINLSVFVKLQ